MLEPVRGALVGGRELGIGVFVVAGASCCVERPAELGLIIAGVVVVTIVVCTAAVPSVEAKCKVESHIIVVSITDWVLSSVVDRNAVGKILIVEGDEDNTAAVVAGEDIKRSFVINSVDTGTVVAAGFVVSSVAVGAAAEITVVDDATAVMIDVCGATVVNSVVNPKVVVTVVVSAEVVVTVIVGA